MIGSLQMLAKQDAAFIAGQGGFQCDFTLIAPDGTEMTGTGLATGTWKEFMDDSKGKPDNSTSFSFDIPEIQLIAAAYPYKQRQRVFLEGHFLAIDDGAGMSGQFKISETHYNATFGLIVATLGRSVYVSTNTKSNTQSGI